MGSDTSETQARTSPTPDTGVYEAHQVSAQNRSRSLSLALGLTGLAAAMLIALFGR